MLKFNELPKQPKNKVQVVSEKTGKILGYFEFLVGQNEYQFLPAFETKFCTTALCEICAKAQELNKK